MTSSNPSGGEPLDWTAYLRIVSHYEACLDRHGDSHRGVDWPRAEDVEIRHRVMLELIEPEQRDQEVSLLDFGCGAAHLFEFLRRSSLGRIRYSGLDISQKFVALSRRKYPEIDFFCVDVLRDPDQLPRFDYIVLNGVFTEKRDLSFEAMFDYFKRVLRVVFERADCGVAFNVMSSHVDWENDGLFHLPFDTLARFVTSELTRNFSIRNDYGLYEYTTYLYKERLSQRSRARGS